MARGEKSGIVLTADDIPIVLGMIERGDRKHDIAAWFGVNQGRITEAEDGKFGTPPAAQVTTLPPSGPPGIKGRRLRDDAQIALNALTKGDATLAAELLAKALDEYDANET